MKTKYFNIPDTQELNQKIKLIAGEGKPSAIVIENIYFRMFGIDMIIPEGFECDGNSFPFFMRAFKSGYDIRWLFAGVVHDYFYATQFLPRLIADLIYYYILRDTAGNWNAYRFYKGVRLGGWKAWSDNSKNLKKFPKAKHDLMMYQNNLITKI